MKSRRVCSTAVIAVLVVLASACIPDPAAPSPSTTSIPTDSTTTTSTTSTSTTSTTSTTTTTAAPEPASINVVLSQPSPGVGTTIVSGQSAPIEYLLTVTNSGDESSGPVVVTDALPAPIAFIIGDSVSCGMTPACGVEINGDVITWTINSVPADSIHQLVFSAAVSLDFAGRTSILNTAYFTNVATPGCATPTCATKTLTNVAEEFRVFPTSDIGISPYNTIFFGGPHTFHAVGWTTNDPKAEITQMRWDCIPDYFCQITEQDQDRAEFNFIWDDIENTDFLMILKVVATQGNRTASKQINHIFRLEEPWRG